eukprot:m.9424 g.9424  ORF g.9424 m.9424 type:complete len:218 (+) comp5451_c0_seq2:385-1038(+)
MADTTSSSYNGSHIFKAAVVLAASTVLIAQWVAMGFEGDCGACLATVMGFCQEHSVAVPLAVLFLEVVYVYFFGAWTTSTSGSAKKVSKPTAKTTISTSVLSDDEGDDEDDSTPEVVLKTPFFTNLTKGVTASFEVPIISHNIRLGASVVTDAELVNKIEKGVVVECMCQFLYDRDAAVFSCKVEQPGVYDVRVYVGDACVCDSGITVAVAGALGDA